MLPYPSRKWLEMFCDKFHLCETAERNEFLKLFCLQAEKAIELIVWLSDDTWFSLPEIKDVQKSAATGLRCTATAA